MTRSINATLLDGLTTKSDLFIAQVRFRRSNVTETISRVKGFEINEGNLTAWVKIAEVDEPSTVNVQPNNDTVFSIGRGLNRGGTDRFLHSSWFVVYRIVKDDKTITYHGHIFKSSYFSTAGDVTAQTLISTFLANSYVSGNTYSNAIDYPTDAEWWKSIQFMQDGVTFKIQNMQQFNGILQQKYIANLIDLGDNTLFPVDNGNYNEYEPITPEVTPATPVIEFSLSQEALSNKYFYWRDEAGDEHTQGTSTYQRHSLGYIESTVTPFALNEYDSLKATAKLAPPDLQLTGEDYIRVTSPNGIVHSDWFRIKETYDPGAKVPWYQTLESIKLLTNTEGGGLPDTLATPTRYVHTNTSTFSGQLSDADNNVQQAIETLDRHQHTIAIPFTSNGLNATTAAGSTNYLAPYSTTILAAASNTLATLNGTFRNAYVRTNGQPATGTLQFTLRIANVDTGIVITVAAGSGNVTTSNTSDTADVTAGQLVGWKIVNNAAAASANIGGLVVEFDATSI